MKKQTTALCAATLSLFLLFSLASSDYESYSNDYSDDISNGNYADSDTKAASTTTTAETTKKRLVTPCEFTQDNVVVYIEAEYLDSIPNDDFGLYTLPSGYKYLVLGIVFENHTDSDIFVSTSDFSVYADNSLCSEKIIMVDGVDTMASISSGREATIYGFYAVPANSRNVEIEYQQGWLSDKVVITVGASSSTYWND